MVAPEICTIAGELVVVLSHPKSAVVRMDCLLWIAAT